MDTYANKRTMWTTGGYFNKQHKYVCVWVCVCIWEVEGMKERGIIVPPADVMLHFKPHHQ